uniref:Uncharacterized protein n=1 Tax=Crocodylus porosus TaxID=8502 RepID=A0A7M4E8U5_CROPO
MPPTTHPGGMPHPIPPPPRPPFLQGTTPQTLTLGRKHTPRQSNMSPAPGRGESWPGPMALPTPRYSPQSCPLGEPPLPCCRCSCLNAGHPTLSASKGPGVPRQFLWMSSWGLVLVPVDPVQDTIFLNALPLDGEEWRLHLLRQVRGSLAVGRLHKTWARRMPVALS